MYGVLEIEAYSSIDAMALAADAVIVGRFERIERGRTISPDDGPLYIAAVTVRVDELLLGGLPTDTITLEMPLWGATREDQVAESIAVLQQEVPNGTMVLFLRHKGGEEAGFYRVVNSRGLWTETSRSIIDAPMAEETPAETGEFSDLPSSLDEMVERLRDR